MIFSLFIVSGVQAQSPSQVENLKVLHLRSSSNEAEQIPWHAEIFISQWQDPQQALQWNLKQRERYRKINPRLTELYSHLGTTANPMAPRLISKLRTKNNHYTLNIEDSLDPSQKQNAGSIFINILIYIENQPVLWSFYEADKLSMEQAVLLSTKLVPLKIPEKLKMQWTRVERAGAEDYQMLRQYSQELFLFSLPRIVFYFQSLAWNPFFARSLFHLGALAFIPSISNQIWLASISYSADYQSQLHPDKSSRYQKQNAYQTAGYLYGTRAFEQVAIGGIIPAHDMMGYYATVGILGLTKLYRDYHLYITENLRRISQSTVRLCKEALSP